MRKSDMDFTREKHEPTKPRYEHPLVEAAESYVTHPTETIRAALNDSSLPDGEAGETIKPLADVISFLDKATLFGQDAYEFLGLKAAAEKEKIDQVGVETGVYPPGHPLYADEAQRERAQQFDVAVLKSRMQNRAFSGCDIVPTLTIPGQGAYKFGDISTISISTHRESFPVRMLGRTNPIGFTRGPRTVAGTIIFSVLDMYPWYKAIKNADQPVWTHSNTYPLADSLPPFDITVTFHNEYEGTGSVMRLFGVVLIDDGMTISIDDLVTENTYSFLAAGVAPIHQVKAYAAGDRYDQAKMNLENLQSNINQNVGKLIDKGISASENIKPIPWLVPETRPSTLGGK